MKKAIPFIFLLTLVLSTLAPLLSQEYKGKGRVMGYVFDENETPLAGVKVKLFSLMAKQGFEVVTDGEGKWIASWIRSGGWNVDFEKAGYTPKMIMIQVQEYSRNPELRVVMKKAAGHVVSEDLKKVLVQGNLLFDQNKYEEAAAVYRDILEKYPDSYVIGINLGNCYFALERYEEAEAQYLKVLEKEPGNTDALLGVGNAHTNRGRREKALEWYGKIEFDKIDDPVVLYNIGTIFYNNSQHGDALKYYRKAVALQKDFPDGLYQLGLTCLTLGQYPESREAFESYLRLDADSERSAQVRSFLDFLKKN